MNQFTLPRDFGPGDLVNDSTLQHRIYTDESVFQEELDRIFHVAWIYLGHECQIADPETYFLGHIGRTSVIVSRDKQGEINVFENRCAHRGAPVCSALYGSSKRLTCPYHGWNFKADGSLLGVPFPSDYPDTFNKSDHGLKQVPRVQSYRGFIFASMAETGPTLEEFLGNASTALDDFMDRAPQGTMQLADETPLRHRFRGNWKIQFENLNDIIHPAFAHASATNANVIATGNAGDGVANIVANFGEFLKKVGGLRSVTTKYGHSYTPGLAELMGTLAGADEELKGVLTPSVGAEEAERIVGVDNWVTLIYPSLIIKPGNQNLRIIRPLSVNETEVTMHNFRLDGAPDSVWSEAYDYYRLLGSPASPILADDLAIYEMVQADYNRDYRVSVHRGEGKETVDEEGNVQIPGTSEGYIRGQYSVWKNYMTQASS